MDLHRFFFFFFSWWCFKTATLYPLILTVLLLLDSPPQVAISGSPVSHLPGFPSPLPFDLETGEASTGYVTVDDQEAAAAAHHQKEDGLELFYYFVKSERNPKEDPLLLWLTGGPGCSSLSALAYEIGPVYFDVEDYTNGSLPTLVLNPHSWTKVASIIFVDAPVGTGFSYSRTPEGLNTGDFKSAGNTYQFLNKWLIEHPEFISNPLYVGGDSYSGMVVPMIVQELVNDMEDGNKSHLNFKGFVLGNPVTDLQLEKNSKVPFAHGMGLISEELSQSMKENCKGGKYIDIDLENINCSKDRQVYEECTSGLFTPHILEPNCARDSPKTNEGDRYRRSLVNTREPLFASRLPSFPGCRNYNYLLAYEWANDDRVQKALHVEKGTIDEWIRCKNLPYKMDVTTIYGSSIEYHKNLSTKGFRSLIYSGDHDIVVTHISTEAWIRSLGLSITDDWRPWLVNGQVAGYTRTYSSGLTYATVKGAGHTAPEYKPEESLAMFERWLSHDPL